jgi:hypothetical protein
MDVQFYVIVAILGITGLFIARGVLKEARRIRANERFESRLCVNCGYDLRGTRHERCPECGLLVEAPELPLRVALDWNLLAKKTPRAEMEARKPAEDEHRVAVYQGGGDDFKLLVDHLRARGVDTEIQASSTWLTGGKYSGGREVKFLVASVWSGDVEQAVELIMGFRFVRRGRK